MHATQIFDHKRYVMLRSYPTAKAATMAAHKVRNGGKLARVTRQDVAYNGAKARARFIVWTHS